MSLLSVLMSVYNSERHLTEAVESILTQSFSDFVLFIFDDYSQDHSLDKLRAFHDPRIRIIPNNTNLGLSATLNRGLDRIESKYIARMDADDIAHPERFQHQMAFMERHPEVGVCGTWVRYFGRQNRIWRPPVHDAAIRVKLLFDSPLAHPSVMIRRSVLEDHQLRYPEESRYGQDYGLWTACAFFCKFYNLPEVLLQYRTHEHQSGIVAQQEQQAMADQARITYLEKSFGIPLEPSQMQAYTALMRAVRDLDSDALQAIDVVIRKLLDCNEQRGVFDSACLARELSRRWARVCRRSRADRRNLWPIFSTAPVYPSCHLWEKIQVGLQCVKSRCEG